MNMNRIIDIIILQVIRQVIHRGIGGAMSFITNRFSRNRATERPEVDIEQSAIEKEKMKAIRRTRF